MIPSTAPLLHHARPGVVLARATHEDAHPRGVAAMAAAFRTLDGIVTPLCVQVDLDHVDALGLAAGTLADGLHVLRAPIPDGGWLPALGDAPTTEVDAIDGDALLDWLGSLASEDEVSWVHLRTVELQLRAVWPLWSEPGSPGQRALSERIVRLIEAGWSLEHASGAFASLC